jgi:hypothetical protein
VDQSLITVVVTIVTTANATIFVDNENISFDAGLST